MRLSDVEQSLDSKDKEYAVDKCDQGVEENPADFIFEPRFDFWAAPWYQCEQWHDRYVRDLEDNEEA